MALAQAEADRLLKMAKIFVDQAPLEFSETLPMNYVRELRSTDRREEFLLNFERGDKNRIRLKYQTRARRVIVLARLELNGPRHKNPPEAPYKPGEWIGGTHLHLYQEGFEDRVAFELADAPDWKDGKEVKDILVFEKFMRFCGIAQWPLIQKTI